MTLGTLRRPCEHLTQGVAYNWHLVIVYCINECTSADKDTNKGYFKKSQVQHTHVGTIITHVLLYVILLSVAYCCDLCLQNNIPDIVGRSKMIHTPALLPRTRELMEKIKKTQG